MLPAHDVSNQRNFAMTTNLSAAYSRSLLKVSVPVIVTLASKKQAIGKIIELVPGSIIAFDKSCDEMLELEVSGHPIAEGECVKVGDKFGLRVTGLIMPDEQLQSLRKAAAPNS
jgi:flagellar motor switch protein FliN